MADFVALNNKAESKKRESNELASLLKRLFATLVSSHSTIWDFARCSKDLRVMSLRLPSGVGTKVSKVFN